MSRPTQGQAWPRLIADFDRNRLLPTGGDADQVLVKASALDYDSLWGDDQTGGGGGGSVFPIAAPSSPHALDDEFVSASLDAAWTVVNSPAGATIDPDYEGSWLRAQIPAAATDAYQIRKALGTVFQAGTQASVTFRVALRGFEQYCQGGIELWETTARDTGRVVGMLCTVNGTNTTIDSFSANNNSFSYGEIGESLAKPQQHLWLHLQRSAGNVFSRYASTDGVGWRRFRNDGSWTYDYNYLVVRMYGSSSGGSPDMEALLDFVRFNWLFIPQ